jgi:hypothetical protein
MIGSNPACDIIIHTDAIAEFAFELRCDAKALVVYNPKTNTTDSIASLSRFGIQVSGPLQAKDEFLNTKSKPREWFAKEDLWFDRLPTVFGSIVGGFLPQKARYGCWVAIAILTMGFAAIPDQKSEIDLSTTPITLEMGKISSEIIGFTIQRQGYETGALLNIDVSPQEAKQAHLMQFRTAKLDAKNEIKMFVNKHEIFASEAMPNCLKRFCNVVFRINRGVLITGTNQIKIVHQDPRSFYIIGDMLVRSLPPISQEEIKRVERWEAVANRAYNERDIVPENLVRVRRDLEQALDFLNTRDGAENLRSRIEAFQSEAKAAFEREAKERWSRIEVSQKLRNLDDTIFHLQKLMALYPDTSSEEHRKIQKRMQQVKEMKK